MGNKKHYAAIDVGSNAVRLLIGYVIKQDGHPSIKKVSLTRVPLRLGEDVFSSGEIPGSKRKRFVKTMEAFRLLIDVYDIRDLRAVATSAMREAENGEEIAKTIKAKTGIDVDIIEGEDEAKYIFGTFFTRSFDQDQQYLFIDVGGGSTELTLLRKGKKEESKSFKVGTVRWLKDKVKEGVWQDIKEWLDGLQISGDIRAIGTGGNINRIFKMTDNRYLEPMHIGEMRIVDEMLNSMSYDERIENLRLKPDRADVIIPASKIYNRVMKYANIDYIYVPKIGLADGLIYEMYLENEANMKELL